MMKPATDSRNVISFGPFSLDASRRLLAENTTGLSARTLGVLIELVCRPNEVVSENDLLARVCPQVTAEEGSLRFHIVGLRSARDDGRDGARYIATLKGRGYCFLAGDRVEEIAAGPHFRTLTLRPA
jgi:DNA-binding winged helix-turn-helix (wHTH) protein